MPGLKRKRSAGTDSKPKGLRRPFSDSDDDETAIAWNITYPQISVKSKATPAEVAISKRSEKHTSPFISRDQKAGVLDLSYIVDPQDAWSNMSKYAKFIISDDTYTEKDFVYVNPASIDESDKSSEEEDFWIGRCLECRAKDPCHVYALVAWLYWPKDLPKCRDQNSITAPGARDYHGKFELVASNHLEVLDVTTFAGKAIVDQWLEDDDDNDVQTHLYWRQTFNRQTGQLSDLRRHCTCNQYYNPDLVMLGCDKKNCNIWLHADCLIEDALTKTYNRLVKTPTPPDSRPQDEKKAKKGKPSKEKKLYDGLFTAKIINEAKAAPQFEITDLRGGIEDGKKSWKEEIICLKCGTKLD